MADMDLIPELGRSPADGNGSLLQYSCLGNPTDRGDRPATVCGVTESDMTWWLAHSSTINGCCGVWIMKIHLKRAFLCSGFYEASLNLQSPGCSRDEHPEPPSSYRTVCRHDIHGGNQIQGQASHVAVIRWYALQCLLWGMLTPKGLLLVSQNLSWEAELLVSEQNKTECLGKAALSRNRFFSFQKQHLKKRI